MAYWKNLKNCDMEMTLIYIVLTVSLLDILLHIAGHLMIVFWPHATNDYVKKLLEDPRKYVRSLHMEYFLRNMIYLFFVTIILMAACDGRIRFAQTEDSTEISTKSK